MNNQTLINKKSNISNEVLLNSDIIRDKRTGYYKIALNNDEGTPICKVSDIRDLFLKDLNAREIAIKLGLKQYTVSNVINLIVSKRLF